MESAIYFGTLRHRRFRPARHEFTYPLFMAYLDVDRIQELMQVSRLASYNGWNWASFNETDHFGDARKPLRERLAEDAAQHGVNLPEGKIFLLTHLRYLGYNFNPVSFFYCHDADGRLQLIMAEVKNTFGETQNYWLSNACQTSASRHLPQLRIRQDISCFTFHEYGLQLPLDLHRRPTHLLPSRPMSRRIISRSLTAR